MGGRENGASQGSQVARSHGKRGNALDLNRLIGKAQRFKAGKEERFVLGVVELWDRQWATQKGAKIVHLDRGAVWVNVLAAFNSLFWKFSNTPPW